MPAEMLQDWVIDWGIVNLCDVTALMHCQGVFTMDWKLLVLLD